MKKNIKTTKQITTKERERLDNLIDLAMDRYSIEEIVFSFCDKITSWQDRDKLVKGLMTDENVKDDLKAELTDEINQGMFIVKLETQDQQTKLTDFVCSEIYPYYNQQQNFLFA